MRTLLAFLICLPGLTGCSTPPAQDSFVARSGKLLERTGAMISEKWRANPENTRFDREVNALLDQPQIAPLSRYLHAHRNDERRAAHLQQVHEERERRCQVAAQRYEERPRTRENLRRMRASYEDSCPQAIARFAAQVPADKHPARTTAQPVNGPRTIPAPASGDCYLLFTIKNYSQARDACQAPADAGDAKAQHHLSVIASSLQQYPEALRWARRAAEQSAEGRYQLGQLYLHGHGVARDERIALQWFAQAADEGLARAQYQCADMYRLGTGTPVDTHLARQRYEQAAAQGHRDAQLALGRLYMDDDAQRDERKAHDWLLRAARQDSGEAQYRLAELYTSGRVIKPDAATAYAWLGLARHNGDARAQAAMQRLRPGLDDNQISQAQTQVRLTLERPH